MGVTKNRIFTKSSPFYQKRFLIVILWVAYGPPRTRWFWSCATWVWDHFGDFAFHAWSYQFRWAKNCRKEFFLQNSNLNLTPISWRFWDFDYRFPKFCLWQNLSRLLRPYWRRHGILDELRVFLKILVLSQSYNPNLPWRNFWFFVIFQFFARVKIWNPLNFCRPEVGAQYLIGARQILDFFSPFRFLLGIDLVVSFPRTPKLLANLRQILVTKSQIFISQILRVLGLCSTVCSNAHGLGRSFGWFRLCTQYLVHIDKVDRINAPGRGATSFSAFFSKFHDFDKMVWWDLSSMIIPSEMCRILWSLTLNPNYRQFWQILFLTQFSFAKDLDRFSVSKFANFTKFSNFVKIWRPQNSCIITNFLWVLGLHADSTELAQPRTSAPLFGHAMMLISKYSSPVIN